MKLLLLGATGMLGQAIDREATLQGWQVRRAARRDADIALDIADDTALGDVLAREEADLVINCAALVNIAACEQDPGLAYRINARPAALLAEWSHRVSRPFVHISTDHFYTEGGNLPHGEAESVRLVNEYARTKYAGEAMALTAPLGLVLRTSIVGIRGWGGASFAEWAIDMILSAQPMTLFADAWTSSIDVGSFARATFALVDRGVSGLLNLAAKEVYSKEQFVREMARQMDIDLVNAKPGQLDALVPPRPSSLGLDVTRVSNYLGHSLPTMPEVVAFVLEQYRKS